MAGYLTCEEILSGNARPARLSRRAVLGFALGSAAAFSSPPVFSAERAAHSGPPRRIATPDRAGAQTLLSLGITPIAGVSNDFFNGMGTTPEMPDGVIDTGEPYEPNLEVLQRLKIDLIIAGTIAADTREVLARVAPVFYLNIYTGQERALGRAESETIRLAKVLGIEEKGRAYIDNATSIFDREAQKLEGLPRRPVYIVGLASDGRNMTVYGRNSIMYDVMAILGVENAWTGPIGGAGFINAGVEELAANPSATVLHIDYGAATDAALSKLANSPFWTNLPMVQEGRVHRIPRFEVYGGLPLAVQFAPLLANTLLGEQHT